MKKMLYIMGIEWNWIFQRPQVLALELEKEYDLTVVCTKQPVHTKHQNNRQPKRLLELYQIPFQEKNRLIAAAAWQIHTRVLGNVSEYDMIWVGYPLFGRYIPDDYRGVVIYDCMDNFEALYQDRNEKNLRRACAEELRLLKRADVVFASSLKLREKLLSMCPGKEIAVIRNGYSDNISVIRPKTLQMQPISGEGTERTFSEDDEKFGYGISGMSGQPCCETTEISEQTNYEVSATYGQSCCDGSGNCRQYTLGYIGTISEWFDSELIVNSLKSQSAIRYDLIGPVADHQQIQDERICYRGVIEHKNLGLAVEKLDCLIMPFKINEIILYVDPVKLYEYIAWGKCIIACWYPEIDRFQDFVYFYHDEREYLELINALAKQGFPAKFTQDMQEKFLEENSWQARFRTISGCLREAVREHAKNA